MLLRSPWRPVACPQPYEPYTFLKALFETRSESLYTCPGEGCASPALVCLGGTNLAEVAILGVGNPTTGPACTAGVPLDVTHFLRTTCTPQRTVGRWPKCQWLAKKVFRSRVALRSYLCTLPHIVTKIGIHICQRAARSTSFINRLPHTYTSCVNLTQRPSAAKGRPRRRSPPRAARLSAPRRRPSHSRASASATCPQPGSHPACAPPACSAPRRLRSAATRRAARRSSSAGADQQRDEKE
jgi:hypothetical protein